MTVFDELSLVSAFTNAPCKLEDTLRALDFLEGDTSMLPCENEVDLLEQSINLGSPVGSAEFLQLMRGTREWRANVVKQLFADQAAKYDLDLEPLRSSLALLASIPRPPGWQKGDDDHLHLLHADLNQTMCVQLGYEKSELLRDIRFLDFGEDVLLDILRAQHELWASAVHEWVDSHIPSWSESVEMALIALRSGAKAAEGAPQLESLHPYRNFITDRDGTINNYCGRYASSVQSAYNAIWIGDFANHCAMNTVLITAAPLGGRPCAKGLMELCTMPPDSAILAGSKGREYFEPESDQILEIEPIPLSIRICLGDVHKRLVSLCMEPNNCKFLSLGSGLQYKSGEITIARNDPSSTIADHESHRFMTQVRRVVEEIDPEGMSLSIHDSGTDVNISPLTSDGRPIVDKRKGLVALDQSLQLGVAEGPNLVCGDTPSDLDMVKATIQLMEGNQRSCATLTVLFVITTVQHEQTRNLADDVRSLCKAHGAPCAILPSPDVLVAALAQYTKEVARTAPIAASIGKQRYDNVR